MFALLEPSGVASNGSIASSNFRWLRLLWHIRDNKWWLHSVSLCIIPVRNTDFTTKNPVVDWKQLFHRIPVGKGTIFIARGHSATVWHSPKESLVNSNDFGSNYSKFAWAAIDWIVLYFRSVVENTLATSGKPCSIAECHTAQQLELDSSDFWSKTVCSSWFRQSHWTFLEDADALFRPDFRRLA